MTSTLYLCGASNPEAVRLAGSVRARAWERLVILDDDPDRWGTIVLGLEVAGGFDRLSDADPDRDCVANLVGRTTRGRRSARERIEGFGIPFASLVHESVDTRGVTRAGDITAYQRSVLGAESAIEGGVVVFMGGMVGHGSRIGRDCVIAANAVLNARVSLGEGVYVGTNATILPDLAVGDWATVGAGSVVVQDVPEGSTVMGVPAEVLVMGEPGAATSFEGPAGKIEEAIAEIWRDVLGFESVGVHDDFFRLGGSSLSMMQIVARVQRRFDAPLPYQAFFEAPTIAAIAGRIEELVLATADEDVVDALLREMGEA